MTKNGDSERFRTITRVEGATLAILMLVFTYYSSASLWIIPITFLLFDLGMVGYVKSPKLGAFTYNATHSLILPGFILAIGIVGSSETMQILSYCWIFHIGFDRAMGYGLKSERSFTETSLGKIGKNQKS